MLFATVARTEVNIDVGPQAEIMIWSSFFAGSITERIILGTFGRPSLTGLDTRVREAEDVSFSGSPRSALLISSFFRAVLVSSPGKVIGLSPWYRCLDPVT